MDEAVQWFRAFLDTEWDAMTAYHLEADTDAFLARAAAYEILKAEGVGHYLNRDETPETLQALREVFPKRGTRVLFAVRTLEGRNAWVFYVSNNQLLPVGVGRPMTHAMVVQRDSREWHVQAEYKRCRSCWGNGCDACDGDGFVYSDGVDFGALGRGGETRKLEAPTHPKSLPAYEAL